MNGANSFIKKKTTLYYTLKKVFRTINAELKVDLIHSFWLNEATYFSCKLGNKFNIPVIGSAQGQDVLLTNNYLNKVKKYKVNLFAMSAFQEEFLIKQGVENTSVIEWGVNSSHQYSKEIDVISVGNLIELKNHTYFIQLCTELKKIKPNFKGLLIGDGSERSNILNLIQQNNLSDNLRTIDKLPHAEVIKMIGKSKTLIHTSLFEGFGMVLVEALANGTSVLSSPVGFAKTAKNIELLDFDPKKDVDKLIQLIESDPQKPIVHPISETVDKYIKHYESF